MGVRLPYDTAAASGTTPECSFLMDMHKTAYTAAAQSPGQRTHGLACIHHAGGCSAEEAAQLTYGTRNYGIQSISPMMRTAVCCLCCCVGEKKCAVCGWRFAARPCASTRVVCCVLCVATGYYAEKGGKKK